MPDDNAPTEHLRFEPTDKVPIRYADAFLVAGGVDIFTLNFFQSEIPAIESQVASSRLEMRSSTCFARIALSPAGFTNLLKSMAERAGFALTLTKLDQGGK